MMILQPSQSLQRMFFDESCGDLHIRSSTCIKILKMSRSQSNDTSKAAILSRPILYGDDDQSVIK
eukprot:3322709-Amphidinium_carterae.1